MTGVKITLHIYSNLLHSFTVYLSLIRTIPLAKKKDKLKLAYKKDVWCDLIEKLRISGVET